MFAMLPFAKLPYRLRLSGKLALKQTEAEDSFEAGSFLRQPSTTDVTTFLALVRLGYQFYGKWDASGELRYLSLVGEIDNESKVGSLLELGYSVGRHLRLGAGYNLSHFSDDELGDLQRDSHGFFVRITGHY